MNYKHTQGEWGVENKSGALGVYSEKYNGSYLAHSADGVIDDGYCNIEEQEANAKLMASAPKLLENEVKNLELLEWFLSKSKEFNMWSDKIQVLQNRISETKLVITNATTV